MVQTFTLTHPELLEVVQGDRVWQGGDQVWYGGEWQRKAGCGPTAAAFMVRYAARTRPDCAALCTRDASTREGFLSLMEELWEHITPGKQGVDTVHMFTKGLTSYADRKRVDLPYRELDIGRWRIGRPSIDQCAAFLKAGLEQDAPVAWLNLHHGKVKDLDSWHWVMVVGLELHSDGPILCTYLDRGRERTADFRLWFRTTRLGGGLVYLPRVR